jgi:hypothetical protein
MLILEKKISFHERYNNILNDTLKPEIIYLDEKLIWKRFRKIFGLSHLKLNNLRNTSPIILENLSNNEIYLAILRSCGSIINEIK